MKRTVSLLLALALLCSPASAAGAPDISAGSAILIHADSGETLFERNADERRLIASTTKIMTALVALESCALDERVRVDARAAGVEGSSMYLREGEVLTVEELLYGLLLVSGNDAASALAIHVSGSEAGFAALMNAKARELGLRNTHFTNPHGLDGEGHYSSARDLALIAAAALENEDFARIASTRSKSVNGRVLVNHNRLLREYPGCTGVKTGYTRAAGRALVSSAERGETRLICVTLSDPDDWRDHAALLDWGFENWEYRLVAGPETLFRIPAAGCGAEYIAAAPEEELYALLGPGEEPELELELAPFVIAPVREGETVGRVRVLLGGELLGECAVTARGNWAGAFTGAARR